MGDLLGGVRPVLGLMGVLGLMVGACAAPESPPAAPASVCAVDLHGSYPTEANALDELPSGSAQRTLLCERLANDHVRSRVREVFCGDGAAPQITSTTELLEAMGLGFHGPLGKDAQASWDNGNPMWALIGHSASLSRRVINPLNPRALIMPHTGTHLDAEPGFYVVGFVRGEGFAEIVTHDPDRDALDFFLFKFYPRCTGPGGRCTHADRFSERTESGWSGYSIYDEADLGNTIFDCQQCHIAPFRDRPDNPESLIMYQMNSMWIHWLYDNRHFAEWTDNPYADGPFHEMLQQYVQAHGTASEPLGEVYAGIPGGSTYGSRPLSLENLLEGNGYGNGFDVGAYESDGAAFGLTEDDRAVGILMRRGWDEVYQLSREGRIFSPPAKGRAPFDAEKLAAAIDGYRAFRRGEAEELPELEDLFAAESLAEVGLKVAPGATAPEILAQACTQCHRDGLNESITRARFNVDLSKTASEVILRARDRIRLPADHLRVMPPGRIKVLDCDERARLTAWLKGIVEGRLMADDGEAPRPGVGAFLAAPAPIGKTAITMRAVVGEDERGLVEYRFEELTGHAGATSSGWQQSPQYTDIDLVSGESYRYRVSMRDAGKNESEASPAVAVTFVVEEMPCPSSTPWSKDSDCDTIPDVDEGTGDTDMDGIPDYLDPDDDGDHFSTKTEKEDGEKFGRDIDGDGMPNWLDTDSDGDGESDRIEGGGDTDDDLIPGYLDPDE